jgi:hypothetical protein
VLWKYPNHLEVIALNDHPSRKSVLINLLTLPLAATAAIATVGEASAAAKSPQNAVQYQTKPKGAAKCSGCKFFQAGKTAMASGQCQVVAGKISPNGWCVVYSAKS